MIRSDASFEKLLRGAASILNPMPRSSPEAEHSKGSLKYMLPESLLYAVFGMSAAANT